MTHTCVHNDAQNGTHQKGNYWEGEEQKAVLAGTCYCPERHQQPRVVV